MKSQKKATKRQHLRSKTRQPIVFISHCANADGDIAAKLKEWIETQYQTKGVRVFVSSSEHDGVIENSIKSGTFAKSEIGKKLASHDVLISLLTPTSVKRPWVIFESGAGFCKGRAFIPMLCRGLEIESIDDGNPLKELEVRSANEPRKFATILRELDKALNGKHSTIGVDELRAALCKQAGSTPKTNAASKLNGKPATGRPLGGGVIAPKEELGGVCPDLEHDPHIAFAKSHSA